MLAWHTGRQQARRFKSDGAGRGALSTGALIAGATLAGLALANNIAAFWAERAHPPRGRFIRVDGTRIHYLDRGAGPPIVLLHGNGATAEDWFISGVGERLAQRNRVIAFDRPGFGHSERPRDKTWTPAEQAALLAEVLLHLGITRPIIAGHSWGTLVALELALDRRLDPAGLVLASGYYFAETRMALKPLSSLPVLGDVLRHTVTPLLIRAILPGMIRKLFAPAPVTTAFAEEFPTSLLVRPSQLRAVAVDTRIMNPSVQEIGSRWHSLDMPVTIVAGDGDRLIDTNRQSRRLHEELPGSRFELVALAGHMVHHTAPMRVADLIRGAGREATSSDRASDSSRH